MSDCLEDVEVIDLNCEKFHDVEDGLLKQAVAVCRFCYGNSEEEELLAPCKCSGSVQFIHESCLMTWLKSNVDKHCEICKVKYQFQRHIKPYVERASPNITSWHLAWIVKELVVLDWFHFLETVFICISLVVINRMSSYDLVYQFALIGIVELFYYSLNIFSCFFLLYYQRWSRMNMEVHVLEYIEGLSTDESVSMFISCLENYASLLRKNKRLRQVVNQIEEGEEEGV